MGKSYPSPPDPRDTASASTSTNVGTAIANAYLGNVNQVTPDGNLTYEQTGERQWTDPYTGSTHTIPTFTVTQTLSPHQEAIKAQTDHAQFNLAKLANDQSTRIGDLLGRPVDLSNEAVEGRLFELGRKRLDPVLQERRDGLEARLANQGIGIGSKAYDTAIRQDNEAQNDAYNQLALSGRGQSVQEILAQRNQPINETTALLSGSQVSQPNFVNANMPTIPTTDTAGIINNEYNQRLGIAQQRNAQLQSTLGGLFGLGANALMYSDRRLKTDVKRIGRADNGLPIYAYRYLGGGPVHIGFMADEVEKVHPHAVEAVNGFKAVDYRKAVM